MIFLKVSFHKRVCENVCMISDWIEISFKLIWIKFLSTYYNK
jgi:hypothetical protein